MNKKQQQQQNVKKKIRMQTLNALRFTRMETPSCGGSFVNCEKMKSENQFRFSMISWYFYGGVRFAYVVHSALKWHMYDEYV